MAMRLIEKMLAPIRRKLSLMVTRGVVKRVNDTQGLQVMQVSGVADELLDGVERIQQYGITAHPHSESDCLILNVGANRSHPIVIAVDDRRYRLKLVAGEVALYDDQGQAVKLMRSGIVIESGLGTTHNGDMTINGNLDVTGTLTLAGINMNTHQHPITSGSSAGMTAGPQ